MPMSAIHEDCTDEESGRQPAQPGLPVNRAGRREWIGLAPVFELNRAVAIAMADGIEQGLALLETIHLPGYYLLPAARADLLRRLGRNAEAATAYRQALGLVTNEAERRFLARRLDEVSRPQR
jgi:predicted RNA polymerase sigma factor